MLINVLLDQFLNIKVSQGSVVPRLRCGGIFNDLSLHNHCWVQEWNFFENRSTFAEVMGNHRTGLFFLWNTVYSTNTWFAHIYHTALSSATKSYNWI